RLDHDYRTSDALQNLAHIAILRGNIEEARACLDEALSIARRIDDRFLVSIICKTFGQIHLSQDRLDEAQAEFENYLQAMVNIQEGLRVALAHHHLAEVLFRRGGWTTAKEHLQHATRYFYCQSSATFRGVESIRLFGLALIEESHRPAGLQLLRFALYEAEERGLIHVQAKTHLSLAQTLLNEPDLDNQAIERHLAAAAKLADEQQYRDIADQVAQTRKSLRTHIGETVHADHPTG
ncbi:MAG: tetratricopeptide repeat protein, partial [Anaerolineae bacterium]|nr:tetratricopeptide repeat protein [Anaerolineae bacterium]